MREERWLMDKGKSIAIKKSNSPTVSNFKPLFREGKKKKEKKRTFKRIYAGGHTKDVKRYDSSFPFSHKVRCTFLFVIQKKKTLMI